MLHVVVSSRDMSVTVPMWSMAILHSMHEVGDMLGAKRTLDKWESQMQLCGWNLVKKTSMRIEMQKGDIQQAIFIS